MKLAAVTLAAAACIAGLVAASYWQRTPTRNTVDPSAARSTGGRALDCGFCALSGLSAFGEGAARSSTQTAAVTAGEPRTTLECNNRPCRDIVSHRMQRVSNQPCYS